MKKTTALGLTCALTLSAPNTALAEPTTPAEATTTATATPSTETTGPTATTTPEDDLELTPGMVATAAVFTVLFYGGIGLGITHWAVQHRLIQNPLPGILPNPPARKPAPKPAPRPVHKPAPKPTPAPKPAPRPAPAPAPAPKPAPQPAPARSGKLPANGYYANCAAARSAGVAPIYSHEPGYRSKLDRDGDGVACE